MRGERGEKSAHWGERYSSVAQMEQVSQVGRIDADQLCYNLFWALRRRGYYPRPSAPCYRRGHLQHDCPGHPHGQIRAPATSSVAGDQRANTEHFEPAVWPHIYHGRGGAKAVGGRKIDRPLAHLAIRWVLQQPGINTAVVGAKNKMQVEDNVAALAGIIPEEIFERMTAISDGIMRFMPNTGNVYRYYP